jgi:tetratricopeptide (TPR) repeat protein
MQKYLNAMIVAFLASFVFIPVSPAIEDEQETGQLSREVQNSKATAIFEKILNLAEMPERNKYLPEIEAAYREIIENYPAASIAQECYWRLLLIYLKDYEPPQFERAEKLYGEFIRKYPHSNAKNIFSDAISESYHKAQSWKKLLRFNSPVIKKFIDGGTLSRPDELFMYSEAKFHMGDLVEAEKGFKIVIALFPNSGESEKAKKILKIMHKGRAPVK